MWFLIVLALWNTELSARGSSHTNVVEFSSRAKCEVAAKDLNRTGVVKAFCFEK